MPALTPAKRRSIEREKLRERDERRATQADQVRQAFKASRNAPVRTPSETPRSVTGNSEGTVIDGAEQATSPPVVTPAEHRGLSLAGLKAAAMAKRATG